MFERQRRKRRKPSGLSPDLVDPEDQQDDNSSDEVEDDVAAEGDLLEGGEIESDEYQWKKKVEDALRQWIETPGCRRSVADKHFDNPVANRPCELCNKSLFSKN